MAESPTNPMLARLNVLVGDWDVEARVLRDPSSSPQRGRTSFRWIVDGAFLLQRSETPNSLFPTATAVIGPDADAGTFAMLYFDSRGVSRIYEMDLTDRQWRLWREDPDFAQRFTGEISPDGTRIDATWELAEEPDDWQPDIAMTYLKIG
ncbi:MAG: DUF1579 family protein [Bauldia sp.]|nr:DUF1579 family protein [Bauldia sp.]